MDEVEVENDVEEKQCSGCGAGSEELATCRSCHEEMCDSCFDECECCTSCDGCCDCLTCANCGETVRDYNAYYNAYGNYACESCWNDLYCHDCESEQDDCSCEENGDLESIFLRDRSRFQFQCIPTWWSEWAPSRSPYAHWQEHRCADDQDQACLEWGFDHRSHDPGVAMAKFYFYEGLIAGIFCGSSRQVQDDPLVQEIAQVARAKQAALVAECDPIYLAYSQMVCWGELRYHPVLMWDYTTDCKGYIDRHQTWSIARSYTKDAPPQVWVDVAAMFRDMRVGNDGAIGGEAWATIAEVIHLRLTDKLSPKLFVDRVFNLQHNGGSLLNKVVWASAAIYGAYDAPAYPTNVMNHVGNLHSRDQPAMRALAELAGEESLLRRAVMAANKARHAWAQPLLQPDDPMLRQGSRSMGYESSDRRSLRLSFKAKEEEASKPDPTASTYTYKPSLTFSSSDFIEIPPPLVESQPLPTLKETR